MSIERTIKERGKGSKQKKKKSRNKSIERYSNKLPNIKENLRFFNPEGLLKFFIRVPVMLKAITKTNGEFPPPPAFRVKCSERKQKMQNERRRQSVRFIFVKRVFRIKRLKRKEN